MRTSDNIISLARPGRMILAGLLLFVYSQAYSQTIIIGGDIYGGGRQGEVGTAKAKDITVDKDHIELNPGALEGNTTNITINTGTVRTVFGGGQNGRTYGNTNVTIQGNSTVIGSQDWQGSIYGGVFGAGDGESAYVFGHSHLNINGGTMLQNVYGGGNRADLMGSSTVELRGGTLNGSLFGGARLADIAGYSFVYIDGAHAANDLIVKAVYGGNDIAGNISSSNKWEWTSSPILPSVLVYANSTPNNKNLFKNYNAFVYASQEAENKHIFVGQVFGGGNGDYEYTVNAQNNQKLDMSELWKEYDGNTYTYETFTVDKTPEVSKVYLELNGGTYGYVYGGGNKATVVDEVAICLNDSTAAADIYAPTFATLESMGLNYDKSDTAYTVTGTGNSRTFKSKYQFDRVFGGNNKATMNIQPTWHITQASINNLYSGGNAGNMTFWKGLLLTLTSPDLEVNNVYGGCRRADVIPNQADLAAHNYTKVPAMSGQVDGIDYKFPDDLSSHVLITAGKINNVYGGNDISGKVDGGNGVDIRSSITGDVYGGGNGSYAYTDNSELKNHPKYGDFYYSTQGYSNTATALNAFRPNAEQAWIHVSGTADEPTVIGGSLYLGGNSATLDIDENETANKNATLFIGSYVIAQDVFLGSNGENMIDDGMLAMYHNGKVDNKTFNSITMNNANFAEYIKGVSVGIRPKIEFEDDYVANSTKIGSLYFGGNLGSVTASGTFDVTLAKPVEIFEKLVAGCNNANYTNATYNIDYQGGITTAPADGQPKIRMNLNGITLKPGRIDTDANDKPYIAYNIADGRLVGGNIFGGCYSSGIINGDVVINLTSAAYDESVLFGESGITRDTHLNDVMNSALSMFGGGYGPNASIEGSTTINISGTGRILKVFGGGLEGPVNGNTTINLTGGNVGKIYGGGFKGRINGHTSVYLDGGTVHSAFAGSCNANIRDYAQIFIGKNNTGITTVQNSVYGGNDFGGRIEGTNSFSGTDYVTDAETNMAYNQNVLTASSYVEYVQGNIANSIFGGSCGAYDYTQSSAYYSDIIADNGNPSHPLPYLASTFVHFKGNSNAQNAVRQVFGAGEGAASGDAKQDKMQQRSYVLVNSTNQNTFSTTDVFGAGAYSGLGMQVAQATRTGLDNYSAVVDLMGGWINDAYGASYNEGMTRRTVVTAPEGSTAKMANLYGGGYGSTLTRPCDVYESRVYWNSDDARVGTIFGGNNSYRRTMYAFVSINAEAWSDKNAGYLTTVYGAGRGMNTWAEYTSVNLNDGALAYEVYGGGLGGKVINLESLTKWAQQDQTLYTTIAEGYTDLGFDDPLTSMNGLEKKTNTNVYINKGAELGHRTDRRDAGVYPVAIAGGYGYGGGLGDKAGNGADIDVGAVYGTTYIGVHGGIVWRDIYAGSTYGGIYDKYHTGVTAEANAYIQGGAVRNVYGAGWKGRVGYTALPVKITDQNTDVAAVLANDIPGRSNVVIGIPEDLKQAHIAAGHNDWGFYYGVPTVERNAYGSGEDGGAVIGTSNLTIYNGYIGYRYEALDKPANYTGYRFTPTLFAEDNPQTEEDDRYLEKTYDETWTYDKEHPSSEDGIDRLADSGNAFGGGYTDNASADETVVTVWGGHIRNSVYGGGEVAAVGRGEALETTGSAIRQLKGIYKSGQTHVYIYSGNINRNVFGGGKGYNNYGAKGSQLTDGYVFGQTEVFIYGGEIGTKYTVLEGDGNVFGGGNIGYVFNDLNSKKNTADGYYYKINANGAFITDNGEKILSEDCRVIVTPQAKVLSNEALTLTAADGDEETFAQYSYVPTKFLDVIKKTDTNTWNKLDQSGITIHNAIFAGGNVSSGNELYANTKTVFGNATATIHDLYYSDLITVGTEHIGGLYGDGNLTRVDGYRELNITNYGTDYYGMSTDRVSLEDYHKMNDRERAYFQLKYESKKAFTYSNGEQSYSKGTVLPKDDIKEKFPPGSMTDGDTLIVLADGTPNPELWDEYGFVSIYAGRLINTIQRADFCGIFGSRMVMQGARDRVPETVDFTDYTINRVGEVSLNHVTNPLNEVDKDGKPKKNGNYFGIYNIVNHLEAITSDIDLNTAERTTEKTNDPLYKPKNDSEKTYLGWKVSNKLNRRRNDGLATNKVALASGVYLELTKESSTEENKEWGIITGVLELDLINVMPGLGGGYVYAKNVHGTRSTTGLKHITLSQYNKNAVSNKQFQYAENPGVNDDFQTSGNLVSSKTIIDDCYPISDSYMGTGAAKGHYWYIKGEIYLYDIYLSAYTGAADAYSKTVSIPLTITAGSHGEIKLLDVKPNKFMYYGSDNVTPLGPESSIVLNNITYHLNDTISYWDWLMLSSDDQAKFVDTTYVTIAECTVGNKTYAKGAVLSDADYQELYNGLPADGKTVHHVAKNKEVPIEEVFHLSNGMSHDGGYALTLELDNPSLWNNYYTIEHPNGTDPNKIGTPANTDNFVVPNGYLKAPTYKATKSGIYGQKEYGKGDLITEDVYNTYQQLVTNHSSLLPTGAAVFDEAYVMNQDWSLQYDNAIRYFNKGLVMSKADWQTYGIGNKAGRAYFCVETWKLQNPNLLDEYVFYGTCITLDEITALGQAYGLNQTQIDQAVSKYFAPAYYCTTAGKYGGNYYAAGNSYLTKTAWSAMNPEDRKNFEFNYDAFDILIDPAFSGTPRLYDGKNAQGPTGIYSSSQPIDYTAKYVGQNSITYTLPGGGTSAPISPNDVKTRDEYESLPNEQYHYSPIMVTDKNAKYYVVNGSFSIGSTSYSIGNVISYDTYKDLGANQSHVTVLTGFPSDNAKYYYCRDSYTIGVNGTHDGANSQVENVFGNSTISSGTVPQGIVITEANYNLLPNIQKYFVVHGKTPIGVSTLYVSGQSNLADLSKGRIYTVTYQYDYEESDEQGNNINQISEKHVINIHVQFQGGTPTISQISNPPTVLPGSTIGISQPRVTPGAYEVIGGGWEIFENQQDAENHVNGAEFENGNTILYWYNDDYYLAYYAKTYLGKTYSNAVPIKVGNYHDLARVMADKEHHMYVDHLNVKRDSKIYISNDIFDTEKPEDATKNELDMLKDFFDLSLYTLSYNNNDPVAINDGTQFQGAIPMNSHVKGGANIDFILKSDIAPLQYTDWKPIGTDGNGKCFEGTLHGDGHTISGLNNSLFNYLCGSVYNLGVTGTFTGSGIAENGDGYIQNAWIYTTGTVPAGTKPVYGGTNNDATVINAYYPSDITGYTTRDGVTARPMTAFRNGEVAYDLNGFYLAMRDSILNETPHNMYYYTITDNINNRLSTLPEGWNEGKGYVAKRYGEGDFIYAAGRIPDQGNERMFFVEPGENQDPDLKNRHYFPIYPDDYIFFGQMLTYGYSEVSGEEYQSFPSSINRADRNGVGDQHYATKWLVREESNSSNSLKSNRVYRAPAYFGNSTMDVAYFNANAVLPNKVNNTQDDIYPGLTALDLTGNQDDTKLLDYNALTGFRSDGQTRNLLVYSMESDSSSNTILSTYLADQGWDYTNKDKGYKTIPVIDPELERRVRGHLVNKALDGIYQAASDQFLVDAEDFNAPISYQILQGDYMWYQRVPGRFVESSDAGWESISLPFTAELVTTQDKGELTHFYSGSSTGHEYWLREYNSIDQQNSNKVMFSAPAAGNNKKAYGNTFLWDYYYKRTNGNDKNTDQYFQTYYSEAHTFTDYPFYTAGTPYLIGFPGKHYYEFDLSGRFQAMNTASQPAQLASQVITFTSPDAGTTIGVTDQEYANSVVSSDGFTYTPTYQKKAVTNAYLLSNDGSRFVKNASATTVPFRAYMTATSNGAPRHAGTRAGGDPDILFIGYTGDSDHLIETPVDRGLTIIGQNMQITVESSLDVPATVTITSVAGKLLKQFVIQPGTKVTVPVNSRGIYIVNSHKIAVTR